MKSSSALLLFFILWSTFLEVVIIYQIVVYRKLKRELMDQDIEIDKLHQHFTKIK